MEELRLEIQAAFEKEQAPYPPVAALRRNVVEAVAGHERPSHNRQWLAVAAAAILAILVVAGLMAVRIANRGGAPAPAVSPRADYGPPPAGVPLLYVHDPNNPSWLIGYDWQGQPRGTVKLAQPTQVRMAPDGSAFEVTQGAKGGNGDYLDRLGHLIPGAPPPGMPVGIWADDNRHTCKVFTDQHTSSWILGTQLAGQVVRSVAVISPILAGDGISIPACSFRNDRAIVVRTTYGSPSEFWLVRISDGTVLTHRTYSNSGLAARMEASADGVLIAENSSKSTGQAASAAPATIIRRVSDWSVVVTLDPSVEVLGFSGDDSLVLVASAPVVATKQPTLLSVIDVRSGQALPWQDQGSSALSGFVAQPGGRDFALSLTNLPNVVYPGPPDLQASILIIHSDGSVTKLPGLLIPTW
jgi:hypothetical protein